jgi:hypothetical protein
MQAAGIEVLYYAGYAPEAALLLRAARGRGSDLQLVGEDALAVGDFGLTAGAASEGTLFTNYPDPRRRPEAAAVAARLTGAGGLRLGGLMTYVLASIDGRSMLVSWHGDSRCDADHRVGAGTDGARDVGAGADDRTASGRAGADRAPGS